MKLCFPAIVCCCIAALMAAGGCDRENSSRLQGYVEGEFVYVASPLAGKLEKLNVERGGQVQAGQELFVLESDSEKAARDLASRRVTQSRANLDDIRKGRRPSEIESLEAQLKQSRAALDYSEKDLARQEETVKVAASSARDLDVARSSRDQSRARVAQLEADLETARLGARTDQVAAAEADVRALEAALAKADWDLSQKRQTAMQSAAVFDTLYRQGEWVAAGRPVVVLLPPGNIKARAFVPEPKIGAVRVGQSATVTIDGVAQSVTGKVSFISPRAEYTPPVIYSRESREKLVFMIELVFDPKDAANLHPGQPVDVQLGD